MKARFLRIWSKCGNRFSLRSRIGLGITLSRIIFLPVIFLAIYYIAGMVTATNRIAKVDASVGRMADQILFEVGEMRKAEKNFILLKDPASFRKIKESAQKIISLSEDGLILSPSERSHFSQMRESVRGYMALLESFSQSGDTPQQDITALKGFSGGVEDYQKRIESLLSVAKKSKTQEEIAQSIDEISTTAMSFDQFIIQSAIGSEPSRLKLLSELQTRGEEVAAKARLVNENGWKNVEEERARTESLGHRATLLITLTLIVTFLFSFALTWYLPRRLLQPVRDITQALRRASNGNYDVFLTINAKDELGELVKEFHNLVHHMRGKENNKNHLNGKSRQSKEQEREHSYIVF
jgi:HAMP domain-containing protein